MIKPLIIFSLLITSAIAAGAEYINVDGPNCLNGSLVKSKILPFHRYTSNSEMWIKMKSPLCQKVKINEENSGDIGLIRDTGPNSTPNIISHAFVLLNEKDSFEKHGYGQTEAYQVVKTSDILNEYSVGETPYLNVEYYRCGQWQNFHTALKLQIRKNLDEQYLKMLSIEKRLHLAIVNENFEFSALKKSIRGVASELKSITPENSAENFMLSEMAGRMVSISSQLSALGDRELHQHTNRWDFEEDHITEVFSALTH